MVLLDLDGESRVRTEEQQKSRTNTELGQIFFRIGSQKMRISSANERSFIFIVYS